jgi:hypothetical protein
VAELGVLLPKSMKFNATEGKFVPDSDQAGLAVFVAKSLTAAQAVKFSVAGEGSAAPREAAGMPAGQASAPGGGLGAPIDAPAPLSSSRGFVMGAFLVILAGGAFWLIRESRRTRARSVSGVSAAFEEIPDAVTHPTYAPPSRPAIYSGGILDLLKEELFQLESDRLHEKISQPEYEAAKAGLDALLRRHMKQAGA